MPTYSLFGLTFASEYPFTYHLALGSGDPDFTFACLDQPPIPPDWAAVPPVYTSPFFNSAGESLWRVHASPGCEVMHCASIADYYLFSDRILCCPLNTGALGIEANFLSTVLSYWLERSGTLALHASAVVIPGGAVAFLSNSGNGKSGLAAALIQAGCSLLSDDILALSPAEIGWIAHPGYGMMRMWPDEADFFLGDFSALPRVHPALEKRRVVLGAGGWGAFTPQAQPLLCLFVPERRPPGDPDLEITISPFLTRDALIEIVRHSFTARLVQAAGLQPQRMSRMAQLVRQVPLLRLSYPSGFQHLGQVAASTLDAARTLQY